MGDRANVVMLYNCPPDMEVKPVFFYTHWHGGSLPFIVQRALSRRGRWNDSPYLARIIFSEMVKGQEAGETGFGIAPYVQDNEHWLVVVDCEKGIVGFANPKEPTEPTISWSFDEYVGLSETEIGDIYNSADLSRAVLA